MTIKLEVNGCVMFASDCPTTEEWKWRDRYLQCVRYMERLAATEAVPPAHREHITAWLKCLEDGSLPPPFPSIQPEKSG